MNKYFVGYIGGEDSNGHSCFIHRSGCADIKRAQFEYQSEIEGTLQDAIDSYLDEEMIEMGWDESIVKVYPCVDHSEVQG